MKTALIHYWLVSWRGGEKVLERFVRQHPGAHLYTHVSSPETVDTLTAALGSGVAGQPFTLSHSFVSRLPWARKFYKHYLPLMPLALESLDLSAYDLIISSESGPAKGIIPPPQARHLCYVHTPMRYIWNMRAAYAKSMNPLTRAAFAPLSHYLRLWDVTSAARVDHFVANSANVARRIKAYYRREAEVVHPPVEVSRFDPAKPRQDFFLCVGELVDYKRVDLAVAACTRLNRPLTVVGDGPEARKLKRLAGPNVTFLGRAGDATVAELMATCRGLIFPGEEDFGIVPVEAMAAGAPVIAYGRGGALETVVEAETGLFFHDQSVDGVARAVERLAKGSFDPSVCAAHATRFAPEVFDRAMAAAVARTLSL